MKDGLPNCSFLLASLIHSHNSFGWPMGVSASIATSLLRSDNAELAPRPKEREPASDQRPMAVDRPLDGRSSTELPVTPSPLPWMAFSPDESIAAAK